MKLLPRLTFRYADIFLILYEDRSLLEAGDRLLYLTVNCPSGIPNDVLKESIVRSANEKSDRFLYLAASFIASRRHFECNFFKSPYYVPPGIRWEDPNGVGHGQQLYFLPGLTHFVSRKNIDLLLNQLKN